MAVLGINHVHKRVKEDNLLEGLGERELANPEGVGMDLRLGAAYKIVEGGAFIESDPSASSGQAGVLGKRKGVKTELLAEFKSDSLVQDELIIKPGEYYLVSTIEKVNAPQDLVPLLYTRSSLFRSGLLLIHSKTDPGYSGTLTMGLTNLSPFEVRLQMGARICNMIFVKIEGESVGYRGQHQGGRISPEKEEQQV